MSAFLQKSGTDGSSNVRLDDLLGYTVRRVQIRMSPHLAEQFHQYRLRPTQSSAMLVVEQCPGISQVVLARQLAVERSQIVHLLKKLGRRELVVKTRGTQDKRTNFLQLSNDGSALVERLKIVALASDGAICSGVSRAEKMHLHSLLLKLGGCRS
ncbi:MULTISPECIES: MarR family winged helix-turn-helix transcriptional regulator [Pseudomonas]|uniref:HTH-type transcriptional regulator SarZ n=1 Tax=Pseudomonas syringae pv. papulans TaxID=83963 RepID=A0AA43DV77_PSESX|nr:MULTISPECIES: MarR family winged helix-turn-helix transcriptional regulator [Pseudomonas]KWS32813.1 hypothetical protein AL059_13200 [Pseudomonas syringae pv. papulans]MBD8710251.1 winged helix-turn-helix transcriptional regulator [Pseudomonas sp. CFBP 13711]MBD8715516.1 winged helix-turn-helix transcriptional regulator [Pseudomonas sp. CFBP 13715]MDH4606309.1 winged helix-turn-helix transcriptional regulator [Pseudomonas syringae pv. papulans]MDH4623144.1 winged helix-turn-helix transcript